MSSRPRIQGVSTTSSIIQDYEGDLTSCLGKAYGNDSYILSDRNYSSCLKPFSDKMENLQVKLNITHRVPGKHFVRVHGRHLVCLPLSGITLFISESGVRNFGNSLARCSTIVETVSVDVTVCTYVCICRSKCNHVTLHLQSTNDANFSPPYAYWEICEVITS